MELVKYKDFSKLRLADFLPPKEKFLKSRGLECCSSRCAAYFEMLGGCCFVFSNASAEEVVEISIDETDPRIRSGSGARILAAIGLPLRFGMSSREVVDVLGRPEDGFRGRVFMRHIVGSKQAYRVGSFIIPKQGLQKVWVVREDFFLNVD